MTRISRILLATDLNPDSGNAVEFVSQLARQLDADLHLLHVIPGSPGAADHHVAPPRVPDDIQGQLNQLSLTASMNRVNTITTVRLGRPSDEIAGYAASAEIGLIAMGSRGRTHLAQALLGSVAEQVIRTATAPVLVLPPACFKVSGRRLLNAAKRLAAEFGPGVVGPREEGRARLVSLVQAREGLDPLGADSFVQALERVGALAWHQGPPEDGPKSQFWSINPDLLRAEDVAVEPVETRHAADGENSAALDLLDHALANRASDIHIDPAGEDEFEVRLRIDGRLEPYCRLDRNIATHLIQQYKLLGKLDIVDPFKPQEGRLSLPLAYKGCEVRITTAPVHDGQALALRLFSSERLFQPIESLGLSHAALDAVERMLKLKSGLVLVTGPTGSGKTTTIYSLLHRLSAWAPNIISIEDPIEYGLPFMRQLTVDPRHGVTMTSGLRTILRMDPDVVFLGEIRDGEAADIAMRAASAGRYVFSTLHTRDIASTITALRDLHVDQRSLASNIVGIISQRLVRRLCPDCCRPSAATVAEIAAFESAEIPSPSELMHPVGCEKCRNTGYRDRTGLFEAVAMDGAASDAVTAGMPESDFAVVLRKAGAETLLVDGLRKAAAGITTVEEILGTRSVTMGEIPE